MAQVEFDDLQHSPQVERIRGDPKAVRDALGLVEGDQVVFRVEGRRALLARTPNLLDLAGSVPVPAQKRGTPWPEVRRRTREARANTRA